MASGHLKIKKGTWRHTTESILDFCRFKLKTINTELLWVKCIHRTVDFHGPILQKAKISRTFLRNMARMKSIVTSERICKRGKGTFRSLICRLGKATLHQ